MVSRKGKDRDRVIQVEELSGDVAVNQNEPSQVSILDDPDVFYGGSELCANTVLLREVASDPFPWV